MGCTAVARRKNGERVRLTRTNKLIVFTTGKPSFMQLSSLLGQFMSYDENEVLWTRPEHNWQL